MAKINKTSRRPPVYTAEGAPAVNIPALLQLRRSVLACMLWEDTFYEEGESVADRITKIIPQIHDANAVRDVAIAARLKSNLRHVPLLIATEMLKYKKTRPLVADLLPQIILRADELTEVLAIYWRDGKKPLAAQLKKGLARAFTRFDEYQLAKYDRATDIKLRDVLFLCHAKPKDDEQAALWKRLAEGTLAVPDTWEVGISAAQDKRVEWLRLLHEGRLGGLALLRNLRNLEQAGVPEELVARALATMRTDRILPFRFIAAARAVPQWERHIEPPMLAHLDGRLKMPGHTVLLVDTSYSMDNLISQKSTITRLDAACGVAILLREICEKVDIFAFSEALRRVPPRSGFALRDAIVHTDDRNATFLGAAISAITGPSGKEYRPHPRCHDMFGQGLRPDRLIVLTDEQSHDPVPHPDGVGYMINVSAMKNGVGYHPWRHVDGWSEAVVDYIQEFESSFPQE